MKQIPSQLKSALPALLQQAAMKQQQKHKQ
jgi:hypothetical protein